MLRDEQTPSSILRGLQHGGDVHIRLGLIRRRCTRSLPSTRIYTAACSYGYGACGSKLVTCIKGCNTTAERLPFPASFSPSPSPLDVSLRVAAVSPSSLLSSIKHYLLTITMTGRITFPSPTPLSFSFPSLFLPLALPPSPPSLFLFVVTRTEFKPSLS